MIATLLDFVRATVDGAKTSESKVDPGGGATRMAQHFADPGDDSHPLADDLVVTVSSGGREHAVAYADLVNEPMSGPGEKRIYSRDSDGALVASIWLKADGTVVITNADGGSFEMASGGDVTINGVVIDTSGNVTAPGEVTAKDGPSAVNLSTHLHPDAMGGTGSPTPGT